MFFHAKKVGKDHFRYFTIAVAGHQCAGNPEFMLNDEIVTVDGSDMVTSGPYAGAAWLWFQRGEPSETANATFVSECDGKWTTDHKGNGTAAIYAKFQMTDDVVQAGMPNITAIIDGKDDIRDSRDDTIGFTRNPALIFYDWMALAREEGGFGAYSDEIPSDDWISAQANVCDETVEDEERYAIDAVITTGAPPSEIRDIMVVNCAGTYTYSEGKHLLRVGYWVPPSATLLEADLNGAIQVSPFMSGDQVANEVSGNFVDPDGGYQAAPFGTQTTDPAPANIRQLSLDLAFVTSKYRAERIARIMLLRAQAEMTVVWPANITGMKVKALDTVQVDTSRYYLSNYAFSVASWGLSADFGVVMNLREENAEIYEDAEPVTAASVPTIATAEAFLTERERQQIINQRRTVPTQVLSASESGGVATVTMIEHQVVYPDGREITIEEQVFTGLDTGTSYYLHYADIDREETTPTVTVTDDSAASTGVVGVHDLGRIVTPETGSSITYTGGGSLPPGQTIGREIEDIP